MLTFILTLKVKINNLYILIVSYISFSMKKVTYEKKSEKSDLPCFGKLTKLPL